MGFLPKTTSVLGMPLKKPLASVTQPEVPRRAAIDVSLSVADAGDARLVPWHVESLAQRAAVGPCAAEVEPLPVGRDTLVELVPAGVDARQWHRRLPGSGRVPAQVQIVSAGAVRASDGAEDEVALVGRDPWLHFARRRVDSGTQILRRLIPPLHPTSDIEIEPAPPTGPIASEIEIAVRRHRRRPFVRTGQADRRPHQAWLRPAAAGLERCGPDVVGFGGHGIARPRAVRDEEQGVAVR